MKPVYLIHARNDELLSAFPDEFFHVIHHDGPYGYEFQSNRRKQKLDAIVNDDVDGALACLDDSFAFAESRLVPGGSMFVWTNLSNPACWSVAGSYSIEPSGRFGNGDLMLYVGKFTWGKESYGTGWDWREQTEDCLHFCRSPKLRWPNNEHSIGNWFLYPRPTITDDDHPTPKPLAVLARLFKPVLTFGDHFIDPVCGSGTALVTAKRLGAELVIGGDISETEIERAAATLRRHDIQYRMVTLNDIQKEFNS